MIVYLDMANAEDSSSASVVRLFDLLVELNTIDTVEMSVEIYRLGFPASPVCLELMPYSVNVFPGFIRLDSRQPKASPRDNRPTHSIGQRFLSAERFTPNMARASYS